MNVKNPNWIDWREYMPEEKANTHEFGSVAVLEKFTFLLLNQAAFVDMVPVSTELRRVDLARPLLMGIRGNAHAAVKLAKENFGNEVYPLLRSLIERIVTFYYLQFCDESELNNYVDYANQKTYRRFAREISINGKNFSVQASSVPDLDQYPDLKRAVDKYTSKKSKRAITRWSGTSIEQKLGVIDAGGEVDIMLLMMALVAIYDDGSEALHGTLYGCILHLGMYQPGVDLKEASDVCKHHCGQMTMAFFLFTVLIGGVIEFLAKKIELGDLASHAKDITDQLRDILGKTQGAQST